MVWRFCHNNDFASSFQSAVENIIVLNLLQIENVPGVNIHPGRSDSGARLPDFLEVGINHLFIICDKMMKTSPNCHLISKCEDIKAWIEIGKDDEKNIMKGHQYNFNQKF